MNETRDLYFTLKWDTTFYGNEKVNFQYLEMKDKVKYYKYCNNEELIKSIDALINNENKGLYYKGFYICFKYNDALYYISHHHESDNFIKKVVETLKYNCATDILIKYGELD